MAYDECFIHRATSIIRAWFPKGAIPTIGSPTTYEKAGINGTLNMKTGEIYSATAGTFIVATFVTYLKSVVPKITAGKKFVMILDNARPHHAKKVTQYAVALF